jgi:hypothetical protein
MHSAGFFDEIGRDNVCANLDSAIRRARIVRDGKAESV